MASASTNREVRLDFSGSVRRERDHPGLVELRDATLSVPFADGRLAARVRLPPGVAPGQYTLRVAAVGDEQVAIGARAIEVRP